MESVSKIDAISPISVTKSAGSILSGFFALHLAKSPPRSFTEEELELKTQQVESSIFSIRARLISEESVSVGSRASHGIQPSGRPFGGPSMMDGETAKKIKHRTPRLRFRRHPSPPSTSIVGGISVIFRLLLVRRHHHRRYLSSAGVRPPADHRQLASRSRQGHPLRDRLNTGRLLYEILLDDRREEERGHSCYRMDNLWSCDRAAGPTSL